MKSDHALNLDGKLIIRGIHLELTEAMKSTITTKAERLLRHEPRIVRVRIDVAPHRADGHTRFEAKGHIEIGGTDRHVSADSDDAYNAIDQLIDKLDRQLRKRSTDLTSRRSTDDIRRHEAASDAVE
ncbi:MAG: ribosome-associated translation inhibitor RaiA [Opitutaceae bacterium]|nr:ribosome-associated translation inhibitor RaiA [Opitutaceae bacterium]